VRKTGMSADAPIILSDDDDEPPPLADDGSGRSARGCSSAPSGITGLTEPGLWTSGAIAPGAWRSSRSTQGGSCTEFDCYNLPTAEQYALNTR
jgi:hypothetical protein